MTERPDDSDTGNPAPAAAPAPADAHGDAASQPDPGPPGPQDPGLRADKWLWFARFFKSRSLAAKVIGNGDLRVSGTKVSKPNATVRVGDVLTFPQGRTIRVIRILALGTRRGPASEARTLFRDLQPPEPRQTLPRGAPPPGGNRPKGAGRPTKRERRELDRLHGRDDEI
jgi:ribosome-associated heat shock protein Hsp15